MFNLKNNIIYKTLLFQKIIFYKLNSKLHTIYPYSIDSLDILTYPNFLLLIKKWFGKKSIQYRSLKKIHKEIPHHLYIKYIGYNINTKSLVYQIGVNLNNGIHNGRLHYSIPDGKFKYISEYNFFPLDRSLYGSTPLPIKFI